MGTNPRRKVSRKASVAVINTVSEMMCSNVVSRCRFICASTSQLCVVFALSPRHNQSLNKAPRSLYVVILDRQVVKLYAHEVGAAEEQTPA